MPTYQQLPVNPVPGAVIVKLYRSGDEVRGYVRKVTDASEDDTVFSGEEMEPESALRLAKTHSEGTAPIYVELVEGVQWDPNWGILAS
ncbi:hypothetical protein PYH37_001280 [Sinorhizobium numidicum]|uniref:Uncharacterized protein n=1 Tax=Sinorhizobium numidicum TaxID=680248 RepID=A0ABY8CMM0_9HYPH|nr:hypothetical protein [Sinorhizobium numidicum]WEX73923.1 hypothetical protein PYH37_001280 [Sinorhizobium numidicum]WEX79908.1 hypothetical protein PYH38_001281 [Sinorhizobium numidicum]